jgi:hypothetical protein
VCREDYILSRNQAVILIKETGKEYLYYKHISAKSLQFKNSDNNLILEIATFSSSHPSHTIQNLQARQTHCTRKGEWLNANWQEKTKVLGEKYVAMSFYPTQIPRGLPWELNKCDSNIQISLIYNSWHWSVEINLYHPPQPHARLQKVLADGLVCHKLLLLLL